MCLANANQACKSEKREDFSQVRLVILYGHGHCLAQPSDIDSKDIREQLSSLTLHQTYMLEQYCCSTADMHASLHAAKLSCQPSKHSLHAQQQQRNHASCDHAHILNMPMLSSGHGNEGYNDDSTHCSITV